MLDVTTCEVPVTEIAGAEARRRLVIIQGFDVFWPTGELAWKADAIAEIMRWTNLRVVDGNALWPDMVIVDSERSARYGMGGSFPYAWRRFLDSNPYTDMRLFIGYFGERQIGNRSFGNKGASTLATINVYGQEFFEHFTVADAWEEILREEFVPYGDFDSWHDDSQTSKSLVDRLRDGDLKAGTYLEDDGEGAIHEIVLLRRVNRELQVQGFAVPRSYDPAGHLS